MRSGFSSLQSDLCRQFTLSKEIYVQMGQKFSCGITHYPCFGFFALLFNQQICMEMNVIFFQVHFFAATHVL